MYTVRIRHFDTPLFANQRGLMQRRYDGGDLWWEGFPNGFPLQGVFREPKGRKPCTVGYGIGSSWSNRSTAPLGKFLIRVW